VTLATLSGDALTVLLAGLATNSIGSFVKGLMPMRASVGGLLDDRHLGKTGNDELAGLVEFSITNCRHVLDNSLHVIL
jgi:hypothetical protein